VLYPWFGSAHWKTKVGKGHTLDFASKDTSQQFGFLIAQVEGDQSRFCIVNSLRLIFYFPDF
jgi:hypothetical protein